MKLKLKQFLSSRIAPFLYGTFLSRTMHTYENGNNYIYCYTCYKKSKYIFEKDFNFISYGKELCKTLDYYSGYENWTIYKITKSQAELRFMIENDLNISASDVLELINKKLRTEDWINDYSINDSKKEFIRGFFETRGSVDTCRKLLAQDYFYSNTFEMRRVLEIITMLDVQMEYININFRELQPQFVSGENQRNTQLRINSYWYANNVGFINKYKAEIFKNCFYVHGSKEVKNIIYFDVEVPKISNINQTFIKYLNFFTNYVYEKKLNDSTINQFRHKLGFDDSIPTKIYRDKALRDLFDTIEEDKCAICGTMKTFTNKTTGRQHFEIHHVISLANDKEVDNISNMVKLCPTCHDSLSKNRCSKETQKNAIIGILANKPNVKQFASNYLQIENIDDLASKIQEMLK